MDFLPPFAAFLLLFAGTDFFIKAPFEDAAFFADVPAFFSKELLFVFTPPTFTEGSDAEEPLFLADFSVPEERLFPAVKGLAFSAEGTFLLICFVIVRKHTSEKYILCSGASCP